MAYHQGDRDAAEIYYTESLAINRALEDRRGMAVVLGNLGNLASDRGDFTRAREMYTESLELKRGLGGSPYGEAITLSNLGNVHLRQKDVAQARAHYEEALRLHDSVGNEGGKIIVYVCLGVAAFAEDDLENTRANYVHALRLCRRLGEQLWTAQALEGLARAAVKTGPQDAAIRLYGAASKLRDHIGTPIEPEDDEARSEDLTALRSMMEEAAYTAAWKEGHSLDAEQAIDYALAVFAAPELS